MRGVRALSKVPRWLPALAMMALIFFLSSLPSAEIPDLGALDLLAKKGGHLVIYGLLGLSYYYALATRVQGNPRRWISLLLAVLYAVSDEWHQSFVPGRNAWWVDVVVDGSGAALALFLLTRQSNSRSKVAS